MFATLEQEFRVTVVDDDDVGRDDLMDELRGCGMEPQAVFGPYGTDMDRILAEISVQRPRFVICDHKLQPRNLAQFNGSEVVKRLLEQKQPAMLLTMYQSTDRLGIRADRFDIPVVVGRDAFKAENVFRYFEICKRELEDRPTDARRAHRVLIQIDDLQDFPLSKSEHINATVPSWSPDTAIQIPRSCFDASIADHLKPGGMVLGYVNIGATKEDDLFFSNLNEILYPPEDDD